MELQESLKLKRQRPREVPGGPRALGVEETWQAGVSETWGLICSSEVLSKSLSEPSPNDHRSSYSNMVGKCVLRPMPAHHPLSEGKVSTWCAWLLLSLLTWPLLFSIHTAVWWPESEDQNSDLPFPALWPQALHPPAWRRRPRPRRRRERKRQGMPRCWPPSREALWQTPSP